jgi:hypothetical protein
VASLLIGISLVSAALGTVVNLLAVWALWGPGAAVVAFLVFPLTDVLMPLYLLGMGGWLSLVLTWGIPLGCCALVSAFAKREVPA